MKNTIENRRNREIRTRIAHERISAGLVVPGVTQTSGRAIHYAAMTVRGTRRALRRDDHAGGAVGVDNARIRFAAVGFHPLFADLRGKSSRSIYHHQTDNRSHMRIEFLA